MKTNYKKLAQEIKMNLLTLYSGGGSDNEVREYWESKVGELEETDPEFSERKLKVEVFNLSHSYN